MAYNDNNNNSTEELKIHGKFVKFALGNLGRLNCTILVPTDRCACFRILLNGRNEEENESILDKILDVLKAVGDKVMKKHEENDENHFSKVEFKVTLQMLIPEEKCGYVMGSKFRTLKRIQNDCELTLAKIDRQIYEPIPGFERLILQSEKMEGLRQARKEIGNLLRSKTREISLKGQTFEGKRFNGERDDFLDKISRNKKQFQMEQRDVEMEMKYPEKVAAKKLHDNKIYHGLRNYENGRILPDGTCRIINKGSPLAFKAVEAKLDEFKEELDNKMKNGENGKESMESESSETNSSKNGKEGVKAYEQGQFEEGIFEKKDEMKIDGGGNGKAAKNENVTMRKKEENNKKLLRSRSIVKTKSTKAAENKILGTMRARSISVSPPKKLIQQAVHRTGPKYKHQTNNEKEASPTLSHSTSGSSSPQPSQVVDFKSEKENLPVKKNDKTESTDRIDKIRKNLNQKMEQSTSKQKPMEKEGKDEDENNKNKEFVQKILKVINNGKMSKPTYLCQIRINGRTKEAELESDKISQKMLTEFNKSMKSPCNREEVKFYRNEAKTDMGLNEKGPEYLMKRKEYVKKNWEPKANLNIDQNEGNKKCLDLAKATHKIGQQMEKDELIRPFERKLSSNFSEESNKSPNSSKDEKKTGENGKASRKYDGMNKIPPAMLELANKIVATLSSDFVRGYKLDKFKSDFFEDHNQNIEEEAQKLGYNSLEEMLESNEMKSKIFWKDEENDHGSKSRIYRAKRNKWNADIYKQQSNAELEKRRKKEKNLRIFEKLYGVGPTKVHGKQVRKSLDSNLAK